MVRLAVIGSGASGLCALKNAIDYGCDVIAFEQSKFVGGLWNYTDQTDKDDNGLEVHSSMYQNLVTNLPIELMCYPNEPFPAQEKSFVSSQEVLQYYQSYAAKYNLLDLIKLQHHVIRIRPINDGVEWEIIVKNLIEDEISTHIFDAVMICTGHHHTSFIPKYKGQEEFKFKQMHSHVYRSSEIFHDEKVLIVGGNNSAVDLVIDSCKTSKFPVLWSNHLENELDTSQFQGEIISKPDVLELTEEGVKFVDGSFETCSLIIYATGYKYSYPFLSVDCGISAGDYVHPLWWHSINIHFRSLAFIGLPNLICPNQMFDLQSQFYLTFLTGRKKWPSKERMMKEYEEDMQQRWNRNLSKRKGHFMGPTSNFQQKFYEALEERAGLKIIKPCVIKMHSHTSTNRFKHFTNYRNVKYRIIDDDNFEVIPLGKD